MARMLGCRVCGVFAVPNDELGRSLMRMHLLECLRAKEVFERPRRRLTVVDNVTRKEQRHHG